MNPSTSMHYSIGVALDRAGDAGHAVEILVDGQWISGQVVVSDGVGVVLDSGGAEHSVVKLDRISAVRVAAAAPMQRRLPHAYAESTERAHEGAMPMPTPRGATV